MDYFLNFYVFGHLDYLLYIFFNRDDLRNFNYPLNYFFNDSVHFHDSLFDSEGFENIVDANNVQNLLVD